MKTFTKEMQDQISPEKSLEMLIEGNQRYIKNMSINRNFLQQAQETEMGQYPFAIILSCIDSRAPSEIIFDQGIGDIFNIRIAGNVVNKDILGSMEFGCKVAGAKLIVVLGHSHCGAVKGACDNVEMGNLTGLINKIKPSIGLESSTEKNRTSDNAEFVSNVTKININESIKQISEGSPILRDMLANGEIKIIGSMLDIAKGNVTFFEE